MFARDGVFLEDLCPKSHDRRWRRSIHLLTGRRCLYCGETSQSIDHIHPLSRGGLSVTENCVPACLSCNGKKGDRDVFLWYRRQPFYDPRRAMALRAWMEGDLRLAQRLLTWSKPSETGRERLPSEQTGSHQTRQAATPLWRWQMAS
ncbi:MAG: HNH endonuclease signature motif containing protein [Cyanobacteriota bacterium]|nr:HNH endonuclease signature motif containing protein [Cyanobacteriota bacterium]